MTDGFLTDEEVVELTGRQQYTKQVDWLVSNRILHYVNAENKVRVTWWAVNHPLYIQSEEPDFEQVS